jgi:hypothetical protein
LYSRTNAYPSIYHNTFDDIETIFYQEYVTAKKKMHSSQTKDQKKFKNKAKDYLNMFFNRILFVHKQKITHKLLFLPISNC